MLQRISIGVEKEKYEQTHLKTRNVIGFLIREAIDLLLEKLESEKN